MKVKIGDKIYSSDDQPIMVIMSDHDKMNISNMSKYTNKYAVFPEEWESVAEKSRWMEFHNS